MKKAKKLSQKDMEAQAKFFRKVARVSSGSRKHALNVNAGNLSMWLKGRNIDCPKELMSTVVALVRSYLLSHLELSPKPDNTVIFGAAMDDKYDHADLLDKVASKIKRHEFRMAARSKEGITIDLVEIFRGIFGKRPPSDVSRNWLKHAIICGKRRKLTVKGLPGGDYGIRQKKRKHGTYNETGEHRLMGCSLDQQAENLGIIDKMFVVTVRDRETGEEVCVKRPYKDMSRRQRKRVNHKAYKAAIVNG